MVGAFERVRPKMMTVVAIMAGLLPDHVERGYGLSNDAEDRRAEDRRYGVLDGADLNCYPRADRLHGSTFRTS